MDSWILQRRKWPLRWPRVSAETTLERMVGEAPEDDPSSAALGETFGLIVRLGRALLGFGLPAHRLEATLCELATSLGYRLDVLCTPTGMMLTLSDEQSRKTRVVRVDPGETDLERLALLQRLVDRVESRELSPKEASRRLEHLIAKPSRYGSVATVAAMALASASSAALLGGGVQDLLPAALLGLLVGLLVETAAKAPTLGRLIPALAALGTTVLARILVGAFEGLHETALLLSAVIVLLPGFTLTVATMELASAHVVSGTSRLVGALATLVQMGFGVALGLELTQSWPGPAVDDAVAPGWLLPLGYLGAGLAFSVVLKAAPRDVPWVLLATTIAVLGALAGNGWLGPELGALVGATLIGLLAHAYARRTRRPALVLLTPGMLILVPGSVGFLSVASMLDSEVLVAVQTAFRMLLVATSLAAGVLLASVAVPPRRSL